MKAPGRHGPTIPGLSPHQTGATRPGMAEVAGVILTILWLGAVALGWQGDSGPAGLLLATMTVVVPPALIWVTVMTMRSLRQLRAEAAHLHDTIEGLRRAQIARQQSMPQAPAAEPAAPSRDIPAPDHLIADDPPDPQAALDFQDVPAPRVTAEDLVLALNFPDDPDDAEGFRALHNALADPAAAKLIRAAQDVLTLLAQSGLYTDDLAPSDTDVGLWRRFARGERGRALAGLAALDTPEATAATTVLLRQDPVFRDAAHHFLRMFDKTLAAFEPEMQDIHLMWLAQTRTARAFMLLAGASGTFD
ncbi:hypothetical protein [Halodurantibacterium flavum]|uniref:Uncharacterized protein n=1 Tax=Halodurantibacterium flavum TaxID=1382802 RepID=A0ABW4S834_9RHOB